MSRPTGLLINGEWRPGVGTLPVRNPFDGSTIVSVAVAGPEQVECALASAQTGSADMRRLPAHERARILAATADTIEAAAAEFTTTVILESGKPRRHAAAEVKRAIQTLRLSAEEANRIHGETVPMDAAPGSEKRRGFFIRQPLGVIAAITPFNFPINLVCHKVGPALAAGNSAVVKPASSTPLSALMLGEAFLRSGLPSRALNILVGPGSKVGMALVRDSRIRMVTFTGSAEVGRNIQRESGVKKLVLEMGANCGAIVDETADLDAAVGRCLVGGYAYSGQVCIHTQRLYLHQAIASAFTARFVAGARHLRCGDPALPETEVGPMINRAALERSLALVEQARSQGAKVLCGGTAEDNVLLPTVITDVETEMPVVCEETFAPIVTIETFRDFSEALVKFNQGSVAGTHEYGLACGVFTRDVDRAFRAAEELEVGNIYVNDSATFRADLQPFGGIRESGLGREGPRFAVEGMTEIKMICFHLST